MYKKRRLVFAAAALGGMIALSGTEPIYVSASSSQQPANRLSLIQISANDMNVSDSLKQSLITNRLEIDPSLNAANVNIDHSRIEMSGFNRNQTGLQTVNARVYLEDNDDTSARSLGYSYVDRATILVKPEKEPQLVLKDSKVTVNNSDAFNPFNYISYINDDSNILPAVKVSGSVNMGQDGDYIVHYTAVDQQGNTTEKDLTVCVRTPQEVIEAREEAERLAREEEERRAAEEEAARIAAEEEARRIEEERIAQEQERARIEAAAAMAYSNAGGSATGSAIVNAARAWAGVGYYVWGGANPATGADCSGFTQYIYSQFGINLAHNNLAQASAGYQVSAAEAMPGDLVVWDAHVGIYTGNGYYVSSMSESLGIIEIPISQSIGSGSFWGIYRIPGVN
ncbi:MAG: NlpC/P60 family protein [Erysipelotrichaceae bacterium]|nr:NlpC/P60 family protein [Erysipelotrichaceae bacterium]